MLKLVGKKYSQFYAEHFYLSKPVPKTITRQQEKETQNTERHKAERENTQSKQTYCFIFIKIIAKLKMTQMKIL